MATGRDPGTKPGTLRELIWELTSKRPAAVFEVGLTTRGSDKAAVGRLSMNNADDEYVQIMGSGSDGQVVMSYVPTAHVAYVKDWKPNGE